MCDFCKDYENNRIFGADIPIKKCTNETNLTRANVFKDLEDKVPSILISQSVVAMGYFNIAFCPMCGRKLVEE